MQYMARSELCQSGRSEGFEAKEQRIVGCGEAVPALRPAGILPAVGNKGRMPSPRRKSAIEN